MINEEYLFIYIHPPKTGGTSLEKLFIDDADITDVPHKHKYASFFCTPQYENYYKFGTVRNPWDRMVSYYHWRLKKGLPMFGKENFEEWLEFITNPSEYGQYQETLFHFATAIDQQANLLEGVNNIIKMENFQEDFDRICDEIGMPRKTLPHVNTSARDAYQTYYTPYTRGIIAKHYEKDVKRYGYSF